MRSAHESEFTDIDIPDDVSIRVNDVAKKFTSTLRRGLVYGLQDLGRNLVGRPGETENLRPAEFWAVDGVTFDIKRGEKVGIVGVNGCGKSTLMRLIAGILPPDRGEVIYRGRLSALIAVGTGFHPYMTGRENIYVNGALLGMDREAIDGVMERILEFADLGTFLDSPVAVYSSGMRARLGMAVATSVDPDILILDEVLVVGDMAFRQRCFQYLDSISSDTSLILITHLPTHIRRVCERVVWISHGKIIADGPADDILEEYAETMADLDREYKDRTGWTGPERSMV